MTNKANQTVLVVCDSAKSLVDFRGKLIQQISQQHRVIAFTPKIKQSYLRTHLQQIGITIVENDLEGGRISILSDLKFLIRLHQLIRKVKPDVLFPYTFKPVIYGTLVGKICGVKKITPMLSGLGYNFSPDKKPNWVGKVTSLLLKLSLTNTKAINIIFQNGDDIKTLLKRKIISTAHQTSLVSGSGVDLEYYSGNAPSESAISFLMVSRLINAKGIKEYHDAAQLVKQQHPKVQFSLIGSYEKNIDSIGKELFDSICTDGAINYLGEIDDVRPSISQASVVVLPSYYGEGVPRCLLEAMAMARPIITCDSVGCRETISTNELKNGFLVPPRNVLALVDAIQLFINNPSLITIFGRNGRDLALQKFDVKLVNRQMIQIMQLD